MLTILRWGEQDVLQRMITLKEQEKAKKEEYKQQKGTASKCKGSTLTTK